MLAIALLAPGLDFTLEALTLYYMQLILKVIFISRGCREDRKEDLKCVKRTGASSTPYVPPPMPLLVCGPNGVVETRRTAGAASCISTMGSIVRDLDPRYGNAKPNRVYIAKQNMQVT